ncbi:hypothetical protein, partial [Clavibacter tessellarius]|uniref:hypothetical protein n=1 Tax=Clavibacter tessellarius TaxID=31965 RepID=UPI001C305C1B
MRADAARAPLRGMLAAAAVLALVGGLSLIGARATAAILDTPDTGMPGRLSVSSEWTAAFLDVAPGEHGHWIIDAGIADAESATLAVEIRSGGELADLDRGVLLQVDRCDDEWVPPATAAPRTAPTCVSGTAAVLAPTPLREFRGSTDRMDLPDITAAAGEHLMLTASVDPADSGDERIMGRSGTVAVGLHAESADPAAVPVPVDAAAPPVGGTTGFAGILPRTGNALDVLSLALVAVGALGLG